MFPVKRLPVLTSTEIREYDQCSGKAEGINQSVKAGAILMGGMPFNQPGEKIKTE